MDKRTYPVGKFSPFTDKLTKTAFSFFVHSYLSLILSSHIMHAAPYKNLKVY